jgi:HEAT repeat protein
MHDYVNVFSNSQHLNTKLYRIFDSQWQAEILHCFSSKDVPKEDKEEFIQALISFDDKCGDFYYYRAYLFAAEALAYFPESSLGDKIVEQILKWAYAYFRQDKRDWRIVPQPLVEAAREVIAKTDNQRVVAAYIQLLHTTESRSVLRVAAKHLNKLDPGNKTAMAALVLSLQFSPNQDTSYQLICSLEEIGCGNETAIICLIDLMQTTLNKDTCIHAIKALGKIGNGNAKAIVALVDFLQINQGDNICTYAVESLWKIDPDNTLIVTTLLAILENNQIINILWLAVDLLAKIAPDNQQAIAILLEKLAIGAGSTCTLWNVTKCLTKMSSENQKAVAFLLEKLRNSETEELRYRLAANIVKMDAENVEAVTALLEILEKSQDEFLKQQAACRLVENNPENTQAIAFLPPIIANHQIAWSRLRKAEQLAKTEEHRQQGISLLFELADFWSSEYDNGNYLPAITILEEIDITQQLAIQALVKVIETTANLTDREYALAKLARLEPENNLVTQKMRDSITTLVQSIQNWESEDNEESQDLRLIKYYHHSFYRTCMPQNSINLRNIFQSNELKQIVIALKQYLGGKFREKEYERHDAAYSIVWRCAQSMTYSEFYLAWHALVL